MDNKKVKVHSKEQDNCAKLELGSTTNDSTINSDSTSFFSDSVTTSNGHLKYCHVKYTGQCICPNLIKYAKARENRKKRELERMRRRGLDSSSSDEDDKICNRAYRFNETESINSLKSLDSSDPSFYTAEVDPSKPLSTTSFGTCREPFNSDQSITKSEQISDLNHNESNDQSMIQQMESGLFSNLSNAGNITVVEKIKPFFSRLSIVAEKESNNDKFKECLTEAYQMCQQDPEEFTSKLTTILEESTPSQDNFSIQYFHNIFTQFKNVEIQNESLPKSFINKTISPAPQNSPKKIHPFARDSSKIIKNTNKSQASPLFVSTLSRFIEAANQIISHPNISALKSPSSPLSDSMSKHNDSTFTYLEKKYVGECSASQNNVLKLTEKDKEIFALYQEQLKALEDSPRIQKKGSSPQEKNNSELISKIDSPCFTLTKTYENTPNIDTNIQTNNTDDSILNEYVTQRRRCSETKRTIREIQASSIQDSGIESNLLSILTECSDYKKFVKTNNKPNLTKNSTPSSKNKEEKINSKTFTPKNVNKISKKPGTGTQSSTKTPVVKTVLSKTKVKSSRYAVSTKSPTVHTKPSTFISPHLRAYNRNRRSGSRSPSPLPSSPKLPSVPKLLITPNTPKFVTSSPISKLTNKNTILESPIPAINFEGKYFSTPGKTPVPKKKPKKTFFQAPTPLREKILNVDNVRSPVKDYINGKEMVVIKHVHRHENSEKAKITPTTKQRKEIKEKIQKSENILSVEHEVGHANPTVIEDVVVDYSIQLTRIENKTVFHLQSKD